MTRHFDLPSDAILILGNSSKIKGIEVYQWRTGYNSGVVSSELRRSLLRPSVD
jgi:hypothetical protein